MASVPRLHGGSPPPFLSLKRRAHMVMAMAGGQSEHRTRSGKGGLADRPALLAALGAACISSSAILVQLAATGAATAALFRCGLAIPGLALLARMESRRRGRRAARSRVRAGVAGLFLAVDLVLWNHAIADVGAGVATVLGNLQVLFVSATAWALFRERPAVRFLAVLPVVMIGVLLVSGLIGRSGTGDHPLAGVVYGVGTSVAYAAFLLVMRRASSDSDHVSGPLADATAGAAAGSLVLGLVFGGLSLSPSLPSLGWLALLAALSQTLGWLLITSTLPKLAASASSLILLLQPAAALVLADVVLGERPAALQVLGAVLVCVGVLTAGAGQPAPKGASRGAATRTGRRLQN
jgi:drug/metabolite transporter (DMT)-like permease